jgi:hypothetical protein
MKITGTFLDEITCDIPSNNWTQAQWDKDFAAMKRIGIDTVIIIRCGFGNQAIFNSKAISQKVKLLPVYTDLAKMFLELAQKYQMKLYFGTYDSNMFWPKGNLKDEVEVNLALIDEVWEKYGNYTSFAGWYMAHEFGRRYEKVPESMKKVADHCKSVSGNLPVIMSPYMWGRKAVGDDAINIEQHRKEWNEIFSILHKSIDIVAFQDGHVDFDELKDYISVNKELLTKYEMTAWSNVESFDRDMPIKFPPIDLRKMLWKMDFAEQAGLEKCITFEFSHFMSPNSSWLSARNLYFAYCEHFGIDVSEMQR